MRERKIAGFLRIVEPADPLAQRFICLMSKLGEEVFRFAPYEEITIVVKEDDDGMEKKEST